MAEAPIPPEFAPQADTYEPLLPIWTDAEYYLDGRLVHPARRPQEPAEGDLGPGWTVQGARRAA